MDVTVLPMTELMLSKAIGCKKGDIMFSSNDTPEAEFRYADEIGGIINLDDITHIEAVEESGRTYSEDDQLPL